MQNSTLSEAHLTKPPSNSGLENNGQLSSDVSQEQISKSAYLVRFEDGDPENPKNFHSYYKAWLILKMSMLAFVGSLGSSIMSRAQADLADYLGVSMEATALTLSLFVLGKSLSASFPISETWPSPLTHRRVRIRSANLGSDQRGLWSSIVHATAGLRAGLVEHRNGRE